MIERELAYSKKGKKATADKVQEWMKGISEARPDMD